MPDPTMTPSDAVTVLATLDRAIDAYNNTDTLYEGKPKPNPHERRFVYMDRCEWDAVQHALTTILDERERLSSIETQHDVAVHALAEAMRRWGADAKSADRWVDYLTQERERLRAALQAQEDYSGMQSELRNDGAFPEPDDPRYTPIIGQWDGVQGHRARYEAFAFARRDYRRAALNPEQQEVGGG